jgi:hypothetical protein
MGDPEVGHDPGLALLIAELAKRRGRLLEEPDRPVVVAGVAQSEREVGLRQRDVTPVAEREQDLERLAVSFDRLVVATAAAVLRPEGVSVYDSTRYQGQQGWFTIGGTSASSPMWAGRAAVAGAVVNAVYVYGNNITYRDITAGNNGAPAWSASTCAAGAAAGRANDARRAREGTEIPSRAPGVGSDLALNPWQTPAGQRRPVRPIAANH